MAENVVSCEMEDVAFCCPKVAASRVSVPSPVTRGDVTSVPQSLFTI